MILAVYAFALWLASQESWRDYVAIANNQAIDHVDGWTRRAAAIALACAVSLWFTLDLLGTVVAGIGAAFLFSAYFRYRLNTLRGLHSCYISPSNSYDRFFIRLMERKWLSIGELEYFHSTYYEGNSHYTRMLHNAGRAAYVTEAIIAAAALVVYY